MTRALIEGVTIAIDSLRANKMRAALTILGVAIGVMVVVTMAAAITGINRSVTGILAATGPKTFYIFRYFSGGIEISDGDGVPPWQRMPPLTTQEADLIRELPTVRDVNINERADGPARFENVTLGSVSVTGSSPSWPGVNGGEILSGRSFTPLEYAAGAHVAVVNDKLAKALFPNRDAIGKRIKVFGEPFDIVGLYTESVSVFDNADQPRLVVPHTTFIKVADYRKGWMEIAVIPTETATLGEAQEQVTTALRLHRRLRPSNPDNFAIVTQDRALDTFNNVTRAFFLAMITLASLGLMIGGVGVVAIMTISVTERTREIGVRKALGATRGEIMVQFLIEAVTLTVIGCLAGLALGGVLTWAVRTFSPIPATIPFLSIVAAVLVAMLTGVLFGLYPASRASRMDPVEALRHE